MSTSGTSGTWKMSPNKIVLISKLRDLGHLNLSILQEGNSLKKNVLIGERKKQIAATKKIINFLKKDGKLSEKEAISLFQLDLTDSKKLEGLKFRIGGQI